MAVGETSSMSQTPIKRRLTLRLPEPLAIELGYLAVRTGKSETYHVEEALKAYLTKGKAAKKTA